MNKTNEIIYIRCIGIDLLQHKCLPDEDYCFCGVKILRKKLTEMEYQSNGRTFTLSFQQGRYGLDITDKAYSNHYINMTEEEARFVGLALQAAYDQGKKEVIDGFKNLLEL